MPLMSLLLPSASALMASEWRLSGNRLTVVGRSTLQTAPCPGCGAESARVHGRYLCSPADLPWAGRRLTLQIEVRCFCCDNGACGRRPFGERLPEVVGRHPRQPHRLQQSLRYIGYAVGGEAGGRLARRLGLLPSPDTILRQLHRQPPPPIPPPRGLGIDAWALRHGHRYGTILGDLERRRPVDPRPDRQAQTVAEWLTPRPSVEVISRDRAGGSAEGARQGAPRAIQVADRWHWLKNLWEAMERRLGRHHRVLCQVAQALASKTEPTPTARAPSGAEPLKLTRTQLEQAPRREQHLHRYQDVVQRYQNGMSIQASGQALQLDRRTVRRYVRAGALPERAARRAPPSRLDAFRPYLRQRWEAGCHNAMRLWREIADRGFDGGPSIVRRALTPWHSQGRASGAQPALPAFTVPSPQRARQWLLDLVRDEPGEKESLHRQALIAQLPEQCPEIQRAAGLANDFIRLVREHTAQALDDWLTGARSSGVAEWRDFAVSLEQDYAAVRAARELPWSNGPVKGHIKRLKLIKRQM